MAQEDLINSNFHNNYDLLILQELFINMLGSMKATSCWRVVYPSSRRVGSLLLQAVMLINTEINTNHWLQICISDTRDMVAVQFTRDFGQLTIHNIYNNCNKSKTIAWLGAHLASLPLTFNGDHLCSMV